MTANPSLPLIEVEGPAESRGLAYGRAADSRIKKGVEQYQSFFETREITWDEIVRAGQKLEMRLAKDYPTHLAELKAIAKGAGVGLTEVLLINGRSEILNAANRPAEEAHIEDGCTSALALPSRTKSGRLLHGQNWDWRPECEETTVVLAIRRDDGPDVLTYVEAGGLARAGLNAAGIAITGNNLETTSENWVKPGVPISVIRRLVLEAPNMGRALQAVASAPRTVSNNMMISCTEGGGMAFDLETTPDEIFWLKPENGLMTHANHFISDAARARMADRGLLKGMDSLYRDQRVHATLEAAGYAITEADFEVAFADDFSHPLGVLRTPVSRTEQSAISATVATILMDAAQKRMRVCPSPYKTTEFFEYRL